MILASPSSPLSASHPKQIEQKIKLKLVSLLSFLLVTNKGENQLLKAFLKSQKQGDESCSEDRCPKRTVFDSISPIKFILRVT